MQMRRKNAFLPPFSDYSSANFKSHSGKEIWRKANFRLFQRQKQVLIWKEDPSRSCFFGPPTVRALLAARSRQPGPLRSEFAIFSHGNEVRIHSKPGLLALLGMELTGHEVVTPDDGRERFGIVGHGGHIHRILRHGVV
jgi:hypothetical protein